jgi:ACT domain-containing protein
MGGIVLLILSAVYRFSGDMTTWLSGGDAMFLKEKKLAKYRELVQEKQSIQARHEELTRMIAQAESRLLTGGTPAIAAVDIQNTLNDIAGRSSAEIKTMRVLTPKQFENDPYAAIPVQISLHTTAAQLKEILYRIENSAKILVISEIRIHLLSDKETVEAIFIVEGFMKAIQEKL